MWETWHFNLAATIPAPNRGASGFVPPRDPLPPLPPLPLPLLEATFSSTPSAQEDLSLQRCRGRGDHRRRRGPADSPPPPRPPVPPPPIGLATRNNPLVLCMLHVACLVPCFRRRLPSQMDQAPTHLPPFPSVRIAFAGCWGWPDSLLRR